MTDLARRKLLKAAAIAPVIPLASSLSLPAYAADFTYKFGHSFPLNHPLHVGLVAAAEKTAKDTNGALRIEVFGAAQLGGDTQQISQLRSGALEFFTTAGLILSTFVPVASIYGLGFAFSDYPQVWRAMDGDLGNHIRGAFSKAGVVPFDTVWDNGFRQISTSARPITQPDDLKGLKLRVPVSPLYTSMFKALGASPASLNLSEVYSALQTKLVDGQENPLVVFETAKFFEVQKYVSLTNHLWDGSWLLASKSAWEALPADMRSIVARNFNAAGIAQRASAEQLNNSLRTSLATKGIVFNQPNHDAFRSALKTAGFYRQWKDKFDPQAWALLTKYATGIE